MKHNRRRRRPPRRIWKTKKFADAEQLRDVPTLYKTQTAAVACVRPAWHTMVPERGERERGEFHFALPTEKMSVLQSSFHGHWVYERCGDVQFVYEVCVNDMYTVQGSVKMKMKTL